MSAEAKLVRSENGISISNKFHQVKLWLAVEPQACHHVQATRHRTPRRITRVLQATPRTTFITHQPTPIHTA